MKTYGLLGNPLSQSFSQKYFSEKFQNENIDAEYLNFELPTIDALKDLLEERPDLSGLNVTIPYKEQVLKFLDDMDDSAKEIKAVNCIKIFLKDGKPYLKGYNTDVIGFSKSLSPLLKEHHTKALILGTGGSSKAVAHALKLLSIDYIFVSRTPKSDKEISYAELSPKVLNERTVIINTSPVGMYPKNDTYPDIPYLLLNNKHLLYDLVYNPLTTTFMQKGMEQGASAKNGLDMLHIQAEEGWAIWNK